MNVSMVALFALMPYFQGSPRGRREKYIFWVGLLFLIIDKKI